MSTQLITNQIQQVVVFNLNNFSSNEKESYAISINFVKEIRRLEKITPIPNGKKHILGMIDLRDVIVPVIDVNELLGFESSKLDENSQQRILITEVDGKLIGLLVDEVNEVVQIPNQKIDAIPDITFDQNHYVDGITKINGKLVILLNIKKLHSNSTIDSEVIQN